MTLSSTLHDGTSPWSRNDPADRNAELALELARLRSEPGQSENGGEIACLKATVERQAAEIEALTRMLEAHPVAEYVAGLERERASLEDHVAELEFRLQRMLASSSWRLTRPVRAAAGLVSKVLRRR